MTSVAFGPVSEAITLSTVGPTPYPNPQQALIFDTGQVGPISNLDVFGTTAVIGYTGTSNVMAAVWYDAFDNEIGTSQSGAIGWAQASPAEWNTGPLTAATRVQVIWATAMAAGGTFGSTSASGTFNGSITYSPVPLCQYGIQPNPDATIYQAVTDGLIDLVVAGVLAGTANAVWIPYVETALAAIEGIIFVGINCSTLPTGNTNLDLRNPGTYSIANLQAWFQNAAWHFFCQCVPATGGDPPPVPPPLPTIQPPTDVSPTQPAFTCDNTDLCGYLSAMKAELEALLAQVSYLRTDVRLIQRQKVPFAYIPGVFHPSLTGSGTLAVQGILGLAVQVTTIPTAAGEDAGEPIARFGLGWVTTGTPDGWRHSVPIRANPQWIDVEPDDTLVGYSLEPLVVANIEEFAREP